MLIDDNLIDGCLEIMTHGELLLVIRAIDIKRGKTKKEAIANIKEAIKNKKLKFKSVFSLVKVIDETSSYGRTVFIKTL